MARRHHTQPQRRASALVEVVVSLPLLALLTIAAAEGAHGLQVQQSLKTIAYETSRAAVVPGVSNKEVEAFAATLLEERRIVDAEIEFEPKVLTNASSGDFVRVTVSAPQRRNSVVLGWMVAWRQLTAHVELMKEE